MEAANTKIQGGYIMIVQHNMAAANTNRQLGITNSNLAKSTEKLSSGYKINRAGDNAAGLTISEKMRGQIRGLDQASSNAQDGISLIQTAEGALNETHSILQRMRELTVQASNDTNVTADRSAIKEEITALTDEVTRIAKETEYNSMKLINGDFTSKNLQVGANATQNIQFSISSMSAKALGIESVQGNVSVYSNATHAISTIDAAIKSVSTVRSQLGALQNRLEHTIANADNAAENLQSAESSIRDVDMAKEMVKYSKDSILQQAAQSMLSQANQSTQGVLSLLQ
jgi:flagellin